MTGSGSTARKIKEPKAGGSTLWKRIVRHKYFYIMLLPVVVWYAIFCYGPMYGVLTAFQDYSMSKGVFASPWVGLKHFETLMNDTLFWRAFRNSVVLALYRIIIEFPIPIILAILLNEIRSSVARKTAQTILYLPHFLSWVIVASIVITFFNPDTGLIAAITKQFGFNLPPNLITNNTIRGLLIGSNIWKEAGWGTIIYLAAISGVDASLYEAAYADGANRFRRAWHVTLPAVRSVIAVQMILTIGSVLRAGFDQVYNMSNKLVMDKADIIDFYVFRTIMSDYQLSYAAAIGLFNSLICTALLLLSNFLGRRLNGESIY
ncbi:MAG: ABC transporter permease [Oscillospiraceae bacterium]